MAESIDAAVVKEAIREAQVLVPASLQITIGGWDAARRLASTAKRLGCRVPYRCRGGDACRQIVIVTHRPTLSRLRRRCVFSTQNC